MTRAAFALLLHTSSSIRLLVLALIGLAGAVNFLSRDHRNYIAAGGLGILIGDGALNYKPERIFEGYYAFALTKQVILTADYQLITNPAYNADRGPVSIFSGRLHGEF